MLILSLLCTTLPCKKVKAGGIDNIKFGLMGGIGIKKLELNQSPFNTSLGLFVNYAFSQNVSVELEYKRSSPFQDELVNESANLTLVDVLQKREWSSSVSANYNFKEISKNLTPFVGVGAGEYYIHDSKAKIKSCKQDPNEEHLDYDMRSYFKRPGFFGSAGLKFQPNSRTILFIQSKCSILFEKDKLFLGYTSNFTDLLNISTGVRFNFN